MSNTTTTAHATHFVCTFETGHTVAAPCACTIGGNHTPDGIPYAEATKAESWGVDSEPCDECRQPMRDHGWCRDDEEPGGGTVIHPLVSFDSPCPANHQHQMNYYWQEMRCQYCGAFIDPDSDLGPRREQPMDDDAAEHAS